jgi:hypothetical protein
LYRLSAQNIITECIHVPIIQKEIKTAQYTTVFIESSDVSCVETFPSYSRSGLRDLQASDPVIGKCIQFIETKTFPKPRFVSKQCKKRLQVLLRQLKYLEIRDSVIYRTVTDPKLGE